MSVIMIESFITPINRYTGSHYGRIRDFVVEYMYVIEKLAAVYINSSPHI